VEEIIGERGEREACVGFWFSFFDYFGSLDERLGEVEIVHD
jgi:hypothetical protein